MKTDQLGLPEILLVVVAFFALLNGFALLARRVAGVGYNEAPSFTAASQNQLDQDAEPEPTAQSSPGSLVSTQGLPDMNTSEDDKNASATSNIVEDDTSRLPLQIPDRETDGESGQCHKATLPELPGRGRLVQLDELPSQAAAAVHRVALLETQTNEDKPCSALPRENLMRYTGLAAWNPNPQSSPTGLPRARLGSLPSRRRYAFVGALKEPRGLASCVIREDSPYPPADAEVTLEVRTNIVRHGRKLLRYLSSSPLDTIYVKIPNASPSSLHQPILERLRSTIIDFGYQRIVVGAGARPGWTLLALDLLSTWGGPPGGEPPLGELKHGELGGMAAWWTWEPAAKAAAAAAAAAEAAATAAGFEAEHEDAADLEEE